MAPKSSKSKAKGKKGATAESGGSSQQQQQQQQPDAPPSAERQYDPDGTLQVARGMSEKDAKTAYKQLQHHHQHLSDKIERHLHGSDAAAHFATQRRQALQQDDASPNLVKLSEKQRYSLQQRQSRKHKKTRAELQRHETKRLQAAVAAVQASEILQTSRAGLLQAETDMERTTALTQTELQRHLQSESAETAQHVYNLQLPESAPYGLKYDRSGRYAVLYGQKQGHVAVQDCRNLSLVHEWYVHQRVRDATFLHNFTMLAAAQQNHVYIYDTTTGAEIHCLQDHTDPMRLQFLPHHWLLASIGRAGWLKYQDTSTGQLVSQHRTRAGACAVLRQNPSNAVLHAGHANGCVTLWSPACSSYLAQLKCHKNGAAVLSLAVDGTTGRIMVTGGADGQVRIWDLRMYRETHAYYCAARGSSQPTCLDISQTGLLAVGHGCHATFWSADALKRKVKDPYMHHLMPGAGPMETIRFRPFEDVCAAGHATGISSMVIPGAGEPGLDTAEYNLNPAQDAKQRQQAEVRALLDKLQPAMIALDADQVAGIEASDPVSRLERIRDQQESANAPAAKKQKTKKRGRSKIQTKLRRKHRNIVDQNTIKLKQALEEEKAAREASQMQQQGTLAAATETPKETAPDALKRFF